MWFDSQAGNQEVLSPTEELFTQGPASAFHLSKPPFPLWLENGIKAIGLGWRHSGEWVERNPCLLPCCFGTVRPRTKGSWHSFTP